MSVRRVLFSILILFFLVSTAAVLSLYLLIDPNQLKPILINEVKLRSGYELTIDQDIRWSLYPRLGVKLSHLSLRADKVSPPFLEMQDVIIYPSWNEIFNRDDHEIKIAIAQLRLEKITAQDVRLPLRFEKNTLILNPVSARAYDGYITGKVSARALATEPHWHWDITATNIDLQSLLQDVNGSNSRLKIAGLGDMHFTGSTNGKQPNQFIQNLKGENKIIIENGTIYGVDLNYLVQSADALINRKLLPPIPAENKTQFKIISLTSVMEDGFIRTQDLQMNAEFFSAKGKGNISLPLQTLQFQLTLQAGSQLRTPWLIPVEITGNLKQPLVQLDLEALRKLLVKNDIDKISAKAGEVISKVPPEANVLIQHLLGQ